MPRDRRKILRFALQFLPLFAALAIASPFLLPGFSWLLRFLTNAVAHVLTPALSIDAVAAGEWTVFRRLPGEPAQALVSIPSASLEQIHLGIVLLPALLLATPVSLRSRLALLGRGLALLVALQVGSHLAFVWVWAYYAGLGKHAAPFQLVLLMHGLGGQLLPVIVWGLVSWPFWFAALSSDSLPGVRPSAP